MATTKLKPKKNKKNIPSGIAYINSTFNNTIVPITDTVGNAISWSSSGNKGFKGSENLHHSLLNWQLKKQVKKLLTKE